MKVTAALALCIAPLALAKAVHNVYPHARRSQHLAARNNEARNKGSQGSVVSAGVTSSNSVSGLSAAELALLGISGISRTDVIFLWVNVGNGAATTVINSAVTTTVTVQANGGQAAATSAAAAVGGEAAATTTAAAGNTATTVATGAGATHSVTVGGAAAGLTFVPASVSAAIGDTVIFTFLAQNHTATQSAFDTPCTPLEGGMDSGFQANPNGTVNPPPQVAMQVMVETPLWFFCKQAKHCGKGMTFSINPTAEKSQALFQSKAIAQAGEGAGGAITGSAPAAGAPAAAAPAAGESSAATSAASAVATSAAAGEAAAATSTDLAAIPTGFAVGSGQVDPGTGACVCAVTCATTSFGGVAVGAQFGGAQGEIPASMLGVAA